MVDGGSVDLVIRPLRGGDADALALVHVTSWRETYAGLVPEEMYGDEALEQRRAFWTQAVARSLTGEIRSTVRVAELDGRIVGFASAGPSRPGVQKRATELSMIYTLAEVHGRGIGDALLDAVLGDGPAQLWVAEQNPRARRFYARHGFTWDGTRKLDEHIADLAEVLLVR
ncbi:ribosomal protein S18 acetylase RimI-like enzyme [Labedella gwakjiensis]|uniref:N-acetyltransferase n=1 Tax=Labedella gwakjiensis TaxID=390269 RepID=A0A2P8GSV4_9MICO|nr:GNAT family N-acetyltransferase [Labedella gwakjiensis]PSL37048.1 ribosomal protein S18 acetylase RimI-like enzyme [Labedella gwakjiensis]RUQ82041.1 N-acetyltransferase [Labedella gwakjiensis]